MQKLIWLDMYFRVTCFKEGRKLTEYASASGYVDGIYTEEMHGKYKEEIRQNYLKKGYFGVGVKSCTAEEFHTKDKENVHPIGYLTIYQRVVCENEGKDLVGYAKLSTDFYNFFTENLWDLFAEQTAAVYAMKGYGNIRVLPCLKEEYDENEDDDVMCSKEWKEEEW